MNEPVRLLLLGGSAGALLVLLALLRRTMLRSRAAQRMYPPEESTTLLEETETDFLTLWLIRAGFRSEESASVYLAVQGLAVILGLAIPIAVFSSGILPRAWTTLSRIPGPIADIFGPVLYLAPWVIGLSVGLLPWLRVQSTRRRRVQELERDLPIYLELFATLGEAGLGFDASLDRILHSQPEERPLAQEFRTFQTELLAGRPRVQCLRRLGSRVDVTTLTLFTSALVQADQVGSGTASILRKQAEDLRDRRRENLLAQAMALPVKLLFPLVICFLPGIFAVTLGPIFYQLVQFADGLMRNSR